MRDAGLRITCKSRWYATPAFPPGSGPDFINAVVEVKTDLGPAETLAVLHRIEAEIGRTREVRWGARVCDLDLLAWEDTVQPDAAAVRHWMQLSPERQLTEAPEHLILPHPRIQDRAFVLVPLAEIRPDWRHPVLGRTAAELRDALPRAELDQIRPIPG